MCLTLFIGLASVCEALRPGHQYPAKAVVISLASAAAFDLLVLAALIRHVFLN